MSTYSFLPSAGNTTSDEDEQIVEGMRERGGDLSQPVKIDYYFYAHARRDAIRAAADLRRVGYRCVVMPPSKSERNPAMADYWLVDASERHVANVDHFQAAEKRFVAEANRFRDAAYDGYESDNPPRLKTP